MTAGAVIGVAGQIVSDLATSVLNGKLSFSNWQTYAGAILGGAIGGAVLGSTGNVNLANAVAGATTTGIGMSLEKLTGCSDKSWAEISANAVVDGTISYGLGKLPGVKNITAGKNNMSAVYKSGLRFLYKGIIIKHNKTEPTYTKTSLFLCEKRRFLWPGLRKEGNLFKLAGPGGLAFFHLTKKEVSKWPMKK